jgi:membrane protein
VISKSFVTGATSRAQQVGASLRRRIYPLDILIRAGQQFVNDNAMTYAAAMSYYVLFSLFPTMIFLVTVFGFIVRDPEIQEQVIDSIIAVVPPGLDIRTEIGQVISDVSQASSPILAIAGLLGTAWTASNMFAALRRSLNLAFNIEQTRNFLIGRFMDMLNLPVILLLALLSMSATAAVRIVEAFFREWLAETGLTASTWNLVYFLLPYVISFIVFLMVYRVLPNARYPFRYLAIGATFAAIGFELAKGGFSLYVANVADYQEVYGALGGVVAFLFFVFIVANIVIFGAEISSEIIKDHYTSQEDAEEGKNVDQDVEAVTTSQ